MNTRFVEHSVEIRSQGTTGKQVRKSVGGTTCLPGEELQGLLSWEVMAEQAAFDLPDGHYLRFRDACIEKVRQVKEANNVQVRKGS